MLRLMLVLSLHFSEEHAGGSWFGADKAKHFLVSAFIESVSFSGARAMGLPKGAAMSAASAATAAVGVAKEVHDSRSGGRFSVQDLGWDAAGAAGALLLLSHTAE